jgi:hypothetical protein
MTNETAKVDSNPNNLIARGKSPYTGLAPYTPRTSDSHGETMRVHGIVTVRKYNSVIQANADKYGISATAIAGAILWEACENPKSMVTLADDGGGLGVPGKFSLTTAKGLYKQRPKDFPKGFEPTIDNLMRPEVAIRYIAVMMKEDANTYKRLADVDISQKPDILGTLYQQGNAQIPAKKLAAIRAEEKARGVSDENLSQPKPSERAMGSFVRDYKSYINDVLDSSKNLRQLLDPDGRNKGSEKGMESNSNEQQRGISDNLNILQVLNQTWENQDDKSPVNSTKEWIEASTNVLKELNNDNKTQKSLEPVAANPKVEGIGGIG